MDGKPGVTAEGREPEQAEGRSRKLLGKLRQKMASGLPPPAQSWHKEGKRRTQPLPIPRCPPASDLSPSPGLG